MVFEDIHWADSALLDFIEYLVDWSRDRPIFVLTLARPELSERRPGWGSGTRNFTSIFLEPLPTEQMDSLLRDPIPGLPDDVRARILERAEGIPFYAVETVRMLIDRGSSSGRTARSGSRAGRHHRGARVAPGIDRRSAGRARARRAAGAPGRRRPGRTFTRQGLAAITGLRRTRSRRSSVRSSARKCSRSRVDPLMSDRGQYGFLQDLVKKVAYDTMSKRERKSRHLAAASYLRSVADEDEIVEVVASHYLDAYLAAPDDDDAGTIKADALETLEKASERAASLGANEEAQRYAERAIELSDDPIDHRRAPRARRRARGGAGGHDRRRTLQALDRDLRVPGRDASRGPRVGAARRADVGRRTTPRGAGGDGSRLRVLAAEAQDKDLAALAAQLGRFTFFAGDPDRADERIEKALQIAEALDLPEVLSQAHDDERTDPLFARPAKEGLSLLMTALDIALEHDKPSAALRAYNNLADLAQNADRYAEATRFVDEGLDLARRVGNRYWESILLGFAYPRFAKGRWDEAVALMDELPSDWFSHLRAAFCQGYVATGVMLNVHRGDLEGAATHLERFTVLESSADLQERTEYEIAKADLLLARGDASGALRSAEEAMEGQQSLSLGDHRVKESVVTAVEAALLLGDLSKAEALLDVFRSLPPGRRTPFHQAHVDAARCEVVHRSRGEDRCGGGVQRVGRPLQRDGFPVLDGGGAPRVQRVARGAGSNRRLRAARRGSPVDLRGPRCAAVGRSRRSRRAGFDRHVLTASIPASSSRKRGPVAGTGTRW